jgi:hypothetical protein
MKRVLMVAIALVALAVPAGTAVAKPSKADKREANKECKALRGDDAATREAFKAEWGNFGKCVSAKAREAKAERKAAKRNAAKDCREERGDTDASIAAFREKYGTNANKKNAFGKCVSQKAKAKEKKQDKKDAAAAVEFKNAAKACDAERSADEKAFADKYGTNGNKKNAFGKCVSQKTHEDGEGTPDDGS